MKIDFMKKFLCLFLFLTFLFNLNVIGAVKVVSTTGNDGTGTGSYAQPWLTVNKGLANLSPGDTLVIQPGTYYSGSYLNTTVAGNPGSPITILATNNAYITGCGMNIDHSNYIVSGVMFSNNFYGNQFLPCALIIGTNADYTIVTNCWSMNQNDVGSFYIREGPNATPGPYYDPMYSAHDCKIVNNVVSNMLSRQAFYIHGSNNVVSGNSCFHLQSSDWLQAWGRSNYFTHNFIKDFTLVEGTGNHPDLFQTYGSNRGLNPVEYDTYPAMDSYDIVVEGNVAIDCTVAIMEMTWDQLNPTIYVQPIIVGRWVFRNNLFINCGNEGIDASASSIDIPGCVFENNTFINCATNASSDVLGFVYYSTTNMTPTWRGQATNTIVRNNAFIACGTSSGIGWYSKYYQDAGVTPSATDVQADYNLVVHWNGSAWTTKTGFSETHGVNTGADPKMVNWYLRNYYDSFRPMRGSPLIDAGTNNSSTVSYDIEGLPRGNSPVDIGCFEFNTNMLIHLDFDQNPTSTNRVVDVTGGGHDGMQMDSTNFLKSVPSIDGSLATFGDIVSQVPDNNYNMSWYAAITNALTDVMYLTNGTFCAWVRMNTNGERWDTIMDFGDTPTSNSNTTNSWCVQYGYPDMRDDTCTNFVFVNYGKTLTNDLHHPSSQFGWPGPLRDGVTWAHLAVAWNALSNTIILYYNGVPWSTNAMDCPFYRLNTATLGVPWVGVNIKTHGGTPQWGDDIWPNYGALKGSIDDLRLYNTNITSSEIQTIASLRSLTSPGTGGGGGGGGGGLIYRKRSFIMRGLKLEPL